VHFPCYVRVNKATKPCMFEDAPVGLVADLNGARPMETPSKKVSVAYQKANDGKRKNGTKYACQYFTSTQ